MPITPRLVVALACLALGAPALAAPPETPPAPTLAELLQLPPLVFPGGELYLQPLDLARTPAGGVWTIAGRTARWLETPGGPRIALNLPGTLAAGDPVRVRYVDPAGRTVVDLPAAPGVTVVDPPDPGRPEPRLSGGAPRTFTGQLLCVCGAFPGERSRCGLRLDGRPLGEPVSASDFLVLVRIPEDVPPGPHEITGDPAAGFNGQDRATFKALTVQGSIDQNELWRGQSTAMRLRVLGDDARLPLRLRNHTPATIRLEGGDDQEITTPGGSDNAIQRKVKGIHRGDFRISYELAVEPCPCANGPGTAPAGPTTVAKTGRTGTPPGPAATPSPSPAASPPSASSTQQAQEGNLCGPDVSADYIAALQRAYRRFQALPDSERGFYDGIGFLYRNGVSIDMRARPPRPPGSEQNEDNQGNVLCPRGVCAGNNPTGQKTLMLGGVCLPEHVGNDIMYGFTAAMLDVPWKVLVAGGHAHQLLAYGGLDPAASHAAYAFGVTLAEHLRAGGTLSPSTLAELMLRTDFYTAQTGMRWKNPIEAIYGEYEWLNLCRPCTSPSCGLLRDFTKSSWSLDDGTQQKPEQE
jgi:hypothetical protein